MCEYVNYLMWRYRSNMRDKTVFVFSSYWRTEKETSSGAPVVLPMAIHRYLVLPMFRDDCWYGVFVQRIPGRRMVFSFLDAMGQSHESDVPHIRNFLAKYNATLAPPEDRGSSTFYPDHNSLQPRQNSTTDTNANAAANADTSVFFVRALACFLQDPEGFFQSVTQETPLAWGEAVLASAHSITRKRILQTLRSTTERRFADKNCDAIVQFYKDTCGFVREASPRPSEFERLLKDSVWGRFLDDATDQRTTRTQPS